MFTFNAHHTRQILLYFSQVSISVNVLNNNFAVTKNNSNAIYGQKHIYLNMDLNTITFMCETISLHMYLIFFC